MFPNLSLSKISYFSLLAISSLNFFVGDKNSQLKKLSPSTNILKFDKYVFFNTEISDSKVYDGYVMKATGGEVADIHDEILRKIGLVTTDTSELKKIIVNIKPAKANDDQCITNIIGQMRQQQNIQTLNKDQRLDFVYKNWQKFVQASMLGVGITDLIFNPYNLVKLNEKITAIDVDGMSLPIIPFEKIFADQINHTQIKTAAENFFKSLEFQELKTKKLAMISDCSGKDSAIYQEYDKAFNKIEKYLTNQEEYDPKDYYFGNIRSVKLENGQVKFNANFGSPIISDLATKFPRDFTKASTSPLLCMAENVEKKLNGKKDFDYTQC